jgi:hypothetical protein
MNACSCSLISCAGIAQLLNEIDGIIRKFLVHIQTASVPHPDLLNVCRKISLVAKR